jgi:cyanate permease
MEHILKEELLLTHAQTSFLYSIPIMMIGAVAIPAGILSDRIGVRKAAGIGATLIAMGSILRGTATTPSNLLVFTFIYGIGLGWSWPNLPKLIGAWVPKEKAGIVTGIYSSGIYIGPALALALTMPLVFPITNTFQGTFFIWSIPPVIAAVLWWILVREPPNNKGASEPATGGNILLRQLIRNRNIWLLSFFLMLYAFFYYTWTGWAPTLLMLKGATPELAGLISSITLWVSIPGVFLIPRLSYKLGLRKPFLLVPPILLAITAWATINIGLSLSWLPMVLVGIADCTLLVTVMLLPIEMVSEKEVGTASGVVLAVGHAGGLIGPWVGGHILDTTGSLDLSLLVLMGVAISGVAIAYRLPETGPKGRGRGNKSFLSFLE